jgi:hypothetical protein
MNDGYETTNVGESSLLSYAFGFESLTKVVKYGFNNCTFTHDVPSEDAKVMIDQLKKGDCSISNLDAFLQVQARTTGLLKQIHREGKDVWVAKSWINGRGK